NVSYTATLTSSGGSWTLSDTAGGGSLTLSGVNTFGGATAVNGGKLIFTTAGSNSSPVTVASGAVSGVLLAAANGQSINFSDLTQNAGSELDVDFATFAPSTSLAPLKVANFTANATSALRVK